MLFYFWENSNDLSVKTAYRNSHCKGDKCFDNVQWDRESLPPNGLSNTVEILVLTLLILKMCGSNDNACSSSVDLRILGSRVWFPGGALVIVHVYSRKRGFPGGLRQVKSPTTFVQTLGNLVARWYKIVILIIINKEMVYQRKKFTHNTAKEV